VSGMFVCYASQKDLIRRVTLVNFLVTFYDIYGRKGEVLFYSSVPDITSIITRIVLIWATPEIYSRCCDNLKQRTSLCDNKN
jgi:hypothetical protein